MTTVDEAVDSFVCVECGYVIHRLTTPPGYESDTCFVCQWIDSNEHLTEQEKKILREKLKPPLETE